MTMNTGIALAVIGGVVFFLFFASKVLNEKPSNRRLSIVEKGLRLIIFFLPFYILSFYFIPKYHEWNRTYLELYKYHGYPCENQTFTLKEDKVLFTRYDGLLPQSAYFITRHEIQEYDNRPKTDYYGSTNIPQGSQFKVIGYYLPIAQHSIRMQYFLVESLDNNKTKAWIDKYSFNVKKCYPEKVQYYDDDKQFSADRGTYGEEKIDIRNLNFVP